MRRDPETERHLNEVVDNLRSGAVEVGVISGTGTHPNSDGATVAEIAVWNEFGTTGGARSGAYIIQPRSFIRRTMRERRDSYRKTMRKLIKRMIDLKMSFRRAQAILGLRASSDIQVTIDKIDDPPNLPETIERKKSDKPLIDTGLLRRAISWARVR